MNGGGDVAVDRGGRVENGTRAIEGGDSLEEERLQRYSAVVY